MSNLDKDIIDVDLTFFRSFSADISEMKTWGNIRRVNIDGCQFFHGDISAIVAFSGALEEFSCSGCEGIEGTEKLILI